MALTAKEKFTVGQRVKMSAEGINQFVHLSPQKRQGVVKGFVEYGGFQNPELLISIVRDGDRSPRQYHIDFWESAETTEP